MKTIFIELDAFQMTNLILFIEHHCIYDSIDGHTADRKFFGFRFINIQI